MRRKQPNSPRPIFDIVPNIIKDRKVLAEVGFNTIVEQFNGGKDVDLEFVHQISDEAACMSSEVTLRLVVNGRLEHFESWHVTLLIYNRRIDGFGYEPWFSDIHGVELNGWHRHLWNPQRQDCDGKVAADWPPRVTVKEFLTRAFGEMNISCKDDHETSDMF